MKSLYLAAQTSRTVSLLICCSALALPSSAVEIPKELPFRDVPTNEELTLRLNQSKPQIAPINSTPSTIVDPAKEGPQGDFMSSSEFLCFGDAMTLVPKGAVLLVPKNLAARLSRQPDVRLVNWSKFYSANRSWITTTEVSSDQAEGNVSLSEETNILNAKNGKVVVATYKGNPISVLPLKAPSTVTSTTPTSRP